MDRPKHHWGDWILARSQFIGIKRKRDFAVDVGCSDNQMTKWLQMEKPPAQMRKGFDKTLAHVLQTNRQMLFHDYASIDPEAAPLVMFSRDQVFKSAVDSTKFHSAPPATMLENLLSKMDENEIEQLVEFGFLLVLTKNDSRRADVEQIARHFRNLTVRATSDEDETKLARYHAKSKKQKP